jgi:hypothetical protein
LREPHAVATAGEASSPWKRQPERRKERELKRQAVIRAAAALSNKKGFHAMSLDEVARRFCVI